MRDQFGGPGREDWMRLIGYGLEQAWGGFDPRRQAFGPGRPPFGPQGPGPRGGHGRGHGPHGGGPGRGRGRRGNVRTAILALLAERPMHGYEMIQQLEERTGGMWRPSPGSVYPTLQLLEDEGLIAGQQAEGKKLYALTDAGREQADKSSAAPWDEMTEGFDWEAVNKLRSGILQLATAWGQVMHSGTDEQKSQAADVLAEARRKLYAILAEDAPADADEE